MPIYRALFLMVLIFLLPVNLRAGTGSELTFSVHPYSNPTAIHHTFQPLVAYLARRTGTTIRIKIAPNYLAHVKAMGTGSADLGFAGPSPYIRMADRYGTIRLLARLRTRDDRNDKMVIICRQEAPYRSVEELAGKSVAFGDHQSYGSHFMPRWILAQAGVSLSDLVAYDFVRSHDNVILSVLHGDFAAGGVRLDVFYRYANRDLRVLAGPFPIPPHVIVVRKDLAPDLQNNLQEALLGLKDSRILRAINPHLIGFQPVSDHDFDQAREIMRVIEH